MNRWHQGLALVRLVRIEQSLPVIGNSWLMVALAMEHEPAGYRNEALLACGWPVAMILAACMSIGLVVYATVTNDMMDIRHDRTFVPGKPMPSGLVSVGTAVVLAMLAFLLAVLAMIPLGRDSVMLTLIAAIGVFFYNVLARHMPAAGIVTFGLLWGLHLFIVSPQAGFLWPVWLGMSMAMLTSYVQHEWAGKRPRLRLVDRVGVFAGWLFWTMAIFAWMTLRDTTTRDDLGWGWLGPMASTMMCLAVLAWFGWRGDARAVRGRSNLQRLTRLTLAMPLLINIGWLMGTGLWRWTLSQVALLLTLLLVHLAYMLTYRWQASEPEYQPGPVNHV